MKYKFRRFSSRFYEADGPSPLTIPEVSDGFERSEPTTGPGLRGVSYFTDEIPQGLYEIHLSLEALQDISCLFLFTGRKQLRECVSLKKGQRLERSFWQSAAEIIPRYHDESCPVRNLFFTYCTANPAAVKVGECYAEAETDRLAASEGKQDGAEAVFLCGDSTVTDHTGQLPYHPGACYAAWGQALPAFLSGRIAVENQAHCGLTTEDFIKEGHFEIVKRYIRPGNLCLIQFAHNDQKLSHLLADRQYPVNLKRMIRELRACQATPVLVTPLGRNIWKEDGSYLELLEEHTQAMKGVAAQMDVPCIDLHAFSVAFIRGKGMEEACNYFHPGDYTHTNEYGACVFAAWIAGELQRLFPKKIMLADRGNNPEASDPIDSCTPALSVSENWLEAFQPPKDLWKKLGQSGIQAASAQNTGDGAMQQGRREKFDAMEKSTANLLKVIQEAKEAGR